MKIEPMSHKQKRIWKLFKSYTKEMKQYDSEIRASYFEFKRLCKSENVKQYIAVTYDDEAVGFVNVYVSTDRIVVLDIYVEPSYRCKKIGSAIMQYLITNFDSDICMFIHKGNIRARRFFAKNMANHNMRIADVSLEDNSDFFIFEKDWNWWDE